MNKDIETINKVRKEPYWYKLTQLCGYRERNILKCLCNYETIRKDETYFVVRFTDCNNSYFEYEVNSNRITN